MMLLTELEKEKIMEILMMGILPLNCVMKKILFLTTMGLLTGIVYVNAQSEKAIPAPPPPKEPPKIVVKKFNPPVLNESGKQHNAFYKRNPSVANLNWKKSNTAVLKLKSGKEEKYNLDVETDKKSFVEKYGEPPLKPPSPPKVDITKFKAPPPPPPKPKDEN